LSVILFAIIFIICLSKCYYYGVYDHILESRPQRHSDDQEEDNSVNFNNLILTTDSKLIFSITSKCRKEFHGFRNQFKSCGPDLPHIIFITHTRSIFLFNIHFESIFILTPRHNFFFKFILFLCYDCNYRKFIFFFF
jgi:hypothetical protein